MGGYMNVSVKSLEYRKRQKILQADRSFELLSQDKFTLL